MTNQQRLQDQYRPFGQPVFNAQLRRPDAQTRPQGVDLVPTGWSARPARSDGAPMMRPLTEAGITSVQFGGGMTVKNVAPQQQSGSGQPIAQGARFQLYAQDPPK